jgi:hypothetical protein
MSNKINEGLYELIKSLSKTEKRYFKLFSSRHTIGEENNYVRLFDFLDRMPIYDEKLIVREFEGEAFMHRFSITKKRLYDHILSALDAFYTVSSLDAQLYKMLHSADILFRKSLYSQCTRVLRSAEKLALKNGRLPILSEIYKKQKRVSENRGYTDVELEDIREIAEKDAQLIQQIQKYDQLWELKSELFFHLSRKGKSRSADEVAFYKSLLEKLPKEKELQYHPFETNFLYNHLLSAFYFATDELPKCYAFLQKNLQLFENEHSLNDSNLNNYFSLLTNMIFVAEKLGNPAVALNCLKQLKLIPNQFDLANNEDMRIKLFASTFSIELSMLTRRGDLQHAMDLLPKIEEGLVRYEGKISPSRKAFIRFKMATVLFGMNEFQSAKKMFSRILNDSELDQNDDILSYAYLMELFVQLELKTDHLLTYSLKNTQRFLKSRNRFFKIEQVLLQFISRRIKCKNEADSLDLWEALHQQLSELGQQETDAWFYEYFDIKTWAESKVTQQEFQHLLKEKFNRPEIKKRKETLDQSLK